MDNIQIYIFNKLVIDWLEPLNIVHPLENICNPHILYQDIVVEMKTLEVIKMGQLCESNIFNI